MPGTVVYYVLQWLLLFRTHDFLSYGDWSIQFVCFTTCCTLHWAVWQPRASWVFLVVVSLGFWNRAPTKSMSLILASLIESYFQFCYIHSVPKMNHECGLNSWSLVTLYFKSFNIVYEFRSECSGLEYLWNIWHPGIVCLRKFVVTNL